MITPTGRRLFLAGLGSAATAAAALPTRTGAQTAGLTTLRLGFTLGDDGTPLIYGQKTGIFAKHGLELQLTRLTSGAAITAGLLSGTFDLGKSSITNLMAAHEKGLRTTLVAAAAIHNPKEPYGGFLLKKDASVKTGKDYNSQLVSVAALGDIGYLAMLKWVADHGGDWKSIKFTEVPTVAAAPAVEQGRVLAAESGQPMIAAALEGGKIRMDPIYDSLGAGSLLIAWATTTDYSSRHPELVRAFARAWNESATYTNAHRSATVDMMAEFTGAPAATIAKMPRATAGPRLLAPTIQPVIDASVRFGQLKQNFPALEMIDPSLR